MFSKDIVYRVFKDLTRRTDSDKILRDKAFNIAKNQKNDEYERESMVYKLFGSSIENENMSDRQLAEKLLKQIIRKSKKRKIHSFFIENILGADLTDMQLISKYA